MIASVDPVRSTVAGAVSPEKSDKENSRLTSPSISLADTATSFVCPLFMMMLSKGSIVGTCPRMLVSAAAALTRPPETVFPFRLWSVSTVPSIALLTSVTEIPGLAALRSPTTPAT